MALAASTKDCTSLGDAELVEMADLSADRDVCFDIGFVSKQREEWVLVTVVREGTKLRGYSFCTLERIGGTPSLLLGVALVDRNAKSDQTLRCLLGDQFRRALLAFPDEDVLLGLRLLAPDGYRAFFGLHDVVPRHEHRPTGEERAWARRLAKRFGNEKGLDDRTFVLTHDANPVGGLDYVAAKAQLPDGVEGLFRSVKAHRGQRLVAFGWAMAEDLAKGKLAK